MKRIEFGKAPAGQRLARIQQAPNYQNGAFRNLTVNSPFTPGHGLVDALYRMSFQASDRRFPSQPLPTQPTDLRAMQTDQDVLVWFGHSSYLIRVSGKTFLIDPVFSDQASPFPGFAKAFAGTTIYSVADLPPIDYLLITHDHYDHLDYQTVAALKDNVKWVICGLGVGAHLEYWGYPAAKIIEKNWYEQHRLTSDLTLHVEPACHQSGRSFHLNNTLWVSFLLKAPKLTLYLGGDSGYDQHFKAIGEQYGPVDLAILDNGQYDIGYSYHMLPKQVLQAARDVKARWLLPVHSAKFSLSHHAWDAPLREITRLTAASSIGLVTPKIGEPVYLRDPAQTFTSWWASVD